jgi:hypothetical protein
LTNIISHFFLNFYRIQLSGNDPPKAFSKGSASENDSSDEEETPEERGKFLFWKQ